MNYLYRDGMNGTALAYIRSAFQLFAVTSALELPFTATDRQQIVLLLTITITHLPLFL
jgi:hypothetical protein